MKKCMVEFNWQLEAAASSRPPRDRPSDRGNRSEPWKPRLGSAGTAPDTGTRRKRDALFIVTKGETEASS